MSFDIPLHIPDNSLEAHIVEQVMADRHLSASEAILLILRDANLKSSPAKRMIGLFSSPEDVALIDEVTRLGEESRQSHTTRDIGL